MNCICWRYGTDQFMLHYRADEWDINKWAWEGTMKVVSKGEECIIRLEDKTTGDNNSAALCLILEASERAGRLVG